MMTEASITLLQEAIARNCAAVISMPSAGELHNCKTRFLAEHEGGFLVEAIANEQPLTNSLIASGRRVGVAFKSEHNKIIFSSVIRSMLPGFAINASLAVDVLLLEMPSEIKTVQRRNSYRVRVPLDAGIKVEVWRLLPRARITDLPKKSAQVAVELRDISTGGLGVRFLPKDGEPPKITTEDRLRVSLEWPGNSLVLEGQMREPIGNRDAAIQSGIRLKPGGDDLQFRQSVAIISRLVGELQREEVRKFRLGLIEHAA